MKLIALAFGLGLLMLVIWFSFQINRPGPDVGEMDGLAILRLTNGEISPAEYCQRRGMADAPEAAQKAIKRLAEGYGGYGPGARNSIHRAFFAVPPARQKEYDQVQKFIDALQKNKNLVIEPTFRAQLVIITEFLARQCLQLASAQTR